MLGQNNVKARDHLFLAPLSDIDQLRWSGSSI